FGVDGGFGGGLIGSNNLTLSVGGPGGDGGDAGLVEVTNRGTITTTGDSAHGIVAQAISGGGGNANFGTGVSNDIPITVINGLLSGAIGAFSAGAGGEVGEVIENDDPDGAGAGGVGDVVINQFGDISVSGNGAEAVKAETIAGGGGSLVIDLAGVTPGSAFQDAVDSLGDILEEAGEGFEQARDQFLNGDNVPQVTVPPEAFREVTDIQVQPDGSVLELDLGALEEQIGQSGGAVASTTAGTFSASGDNSVTASAVSIGGGGGSNLSSIDFVGRDEVADFFGLDLTLGNVGGAENAGGAVASTHDGDVVSLGQNAPGLLSQSIGGGGGRSATILEARTAAFGAASATLGATDAEDNLGGDVSRVQTGDVMSIGANSPAMVLQSIGGGGGDVSVFDVTAVELAAQGGDIDLSFGAVGGTGNDGGAVTLDFTGNALTAEAGASAILAQSIGAGGGLGRMGGVARVRGALGGTEGAEGDGGSVTLDITGTVQTLGDRAHGVMAQSIGGGGGALLSDGTVETLTLSDANSGDGGAISVNVDGGVQVSGDAVTAVFAQSLGGGGGLVEGAFAGSAGGAGTGGTIDLTVTGDVIAEGADTTAVFLQSSGEDGAGGNITASFGGLISGGSGTGTAIEIDGGNQNLVTLAETSVVTAAAAEVISGTTGADVIASAAEVFGDIDLGTGANVYRNEAAGVLRTADTLDLGTDGVLRNAGDLILGSSRETAPATGLARTAFGAEPFRFGENVAQVTELTGSLQADTSSVLHLDAAFRVDGASGDGGDRLDATGTATLDGEVVPTLLTLERATPLAFVTAAGGVSDLGAEVADTAALDFSIGTGVDAAGTPTLTLVTVPDFSVEGATRNEARLGDHFNRILGGDGSESLGELSAFIGAQTSAEAVNDILARLSAEGYAANTLSAFTSGRSFAASVLDCDARQPVVSSDDGSCAWFEIEGSLLDQQADGFLDVETNSTRIAGGAEVNLNDTLSLGVAGAWESTALAAGDRFLSDEERVHLGVGLEQQTGALSLGASVSGSYGTFDSTRVVGIDGEIIPGTPVTLGTGRADHSVGQVTLRGTARFEATHDTLPLYAAPGVDLDATYLIGFDQNEDGLGAAGLDLQRTDQVVAAATPSLELGFRVENESVAMHGFMRAGLALFSTDEITQDAALIGAPESAGSFRASTLLDKVGATLDAGFIVEDASRGLGLRFGYSGSFSEVSETHAVSAGLQFKF
ncbi:MAG: hypothetical protein AAFV09_14130, partial [Pseudomonadota bacterium]